MEGYRSGGTPWFVVIAPNGGVVYDGFRLDAEGLVQAFRSLAGPMRNARGLGDVKEEVQVGQVKAH
jgi:hypothetical protein